jgi:dihydropteroate synthase
MFNLPSERPAVMGVLNVTPDSFSDGGVHFEARDAIESGLQMLGDGADLLDVGGESTRPGAAEVSVEEELRRVIPVVQALAVRGSVSIDTRKPDVARQALAAGAQVVNDVSGLRDDAMMLVCAEAGCYVCIMHMLGTPETMQIEPRYDDVVREVTDYLVGQAERAQSAGIARDRIWLDPGIGFGKTVEHNLLLLKGLSVLVETGYPVLIGVSRKSFLGKIGGGETPAERLEAGIAMQTWSQIRGAKIIRTHDVAQTRRAVDATSRLLARD